MTKDTDAREGEAALRLRTLELQGFKSFPDHTVLIFDHPVTAIVGPNGSGKSNLSDAICWVLGEQSARTLRGDKMEDVIFSGAQLRQRLGAAQVTLRLEDETGGEMAVTRRYYRSGESEYLLNGKTVRLRDVHERFMDTGLGQEGYALIGQGKIDAILSAKSTQRREIFEEAAGISHCRHQKEETQRKLERTQENLTRVADKLEELDLQRGPLKAQAEQAQTFLALREELRTLEISLWMDQLDKQRAQRRKLQADRAAAQASLAACTQETDRLYAESERLLHDLRDQEAQGERLRQRLQAVRQQAEERRQALTLRRERLRTGDETARRLRDELAQQEARTAHLQEEQSRQEERLAQLQKQERKRAEAIARTEERLARTRTQARQAQAAWQETLRREREALADRHREEQAAEEAWMACRLEAHTLAARQKLLGDLARQLEGYARGVKTAMTAARRGELTGVLGPVGQLFHVESRYTVALETALGGAMQDLLVEDEQAGKAVLRLVKRRDGGRVTCRPLTALRPNPLREAGLEQAPGFLAVAAELVDCDERVRPAAQSLLGRTVVVDDLDHGTALAKARRYRFPVVTLDGEILRPGGAMTGGSVSRRGGILSRGAEEAALREKLAQAQERLAEAQHTLEHARQARQLAAQTLDRRQANGPDETIEWNRRQQAQEEDLRAQREEWATLQGTLTAFAPLLAQLRQQLDTADRDRQRQEEALALSARQKEVWTAEIHQLETALDELDQQAERLTAQADQATQDKFALEKRRADTDRAARTQNTLQLKLQREAGAAEQKVLQAGAEEHRLLDRLWDTYGVTHQGAQAIRQDIPDAGQAQRQCGRLKDDIAALGNVNLGAVEEFQRVEERWQYLTDQKNDVETARQALEGVIDGITQEMDQRFRTEFAKIRTAFAETFAQLFGGGKGMLALEDERDALHCGIDIQAQPPGKRQRSISLLSGGERALVAIALYFAILRVRPTPFCVMDEIEAALDEANGARFTRYLRTMAHETQFLLITHRRETMEAADVLYGVTMERQGVSRVLKLDLDQAERLLGTEHR